MPTIETQTNFWLDVELPEKLSSLEYDIERGEFRKTEPAGGPIDPDGFDWDDLQDAQCDEAWDAAQLEYQEELDANGEDLLEVQGIYRDPYVFGSGMW